MHRGLSILLIILLVIPTSGAVTASSGVQQEDLTVEFQTLSDPDNDGAISAFEITIRGDTRLGSSDTFGNNPGEPYFEVEIDGEDVYRTDIVERTESYAFRLTFDDETLEGLEEGEHDLTVELWDADDEIDSSDVGNDDQIDDQTIPFEYEPSVELDLEAARSNPVVGSPVALRIPEGYDSELMWELVDRPAESDTILRTYYDGTASLRPDTAGRYEVRVTTADGQSATTTIQARSGSQLSPLRRYAPRLHFAEGEQYYPTRYEALIYNAALEDIAHSNIENPTVFDIANRSDDWELDMHGDPETDYPRYDDPFPPTVYGSVEEDVAYQGERYTAYTYWLFYVYDPKQPDSIASFIAHQNDLETITVLVNDSGPQWVAASQHYGGEVREWEATPREGTHVDIYPALGAHSNYFRNTENFEGGIPIQDQFIDHDSQATELFDLAEGIYEDRTGDAQSWSHDGSLGTDYQIVPLTGREVWSNYEGAMGPNDESGQIPYYRTRWQNLDIWLRDSPVPDELQVSGRLNASTFSVTDNQVEAEVAVANTGPKPHRYWVVLEAVNEETGAVRVLTQQATAVGTDRQRGVTLSEQSPDDPGRWSFRVNLLPYPRQVSDSPLDEPVTSQSRLVIQTSTPTPTSIPTPTATPTSTPTATSTPTVTPTQTPSPTPTSSQAQTQIPSDTPRSTPLSSDTRTESESESMTTTSAPSRSQTSADTGTSAPSSTAETSQPTTGNGPGFTAPLVVLSLIATFFLYSRDR